MEHSMYTYWRKQPEVLRTILDERAQLAAPFVRLFTQVQPDRVYLVGSGTSLNAERAAAPLMARAMAVEVTTVTASLIDWLHGERPLVMFISQGGSSTNTLEAMEKLSAYPYISLTGEADCEIAHRSACHGLIGCGQELVGPKTVGYTASVMSLYVYALEAGRQSGRMPREAYEACIAALYAAVENMAENLEATEAWLKVCQDSMRQMEKCVLVGSAGAGVTAAEGALKLQETIQKPCIAFEFEEYLHGPILMTDERLGGLFYLLGEGEERRRIQELYACHNQYSRYGYAVSDVPDDDPRVLHVVTTGESYTLPFECVLAPQLMAARLPEIMGIPDGNEIYDVYTSRCPTKYNNGR